MKKYMWTWAICIAVLVSIYGLIYSFTPMNSVVTGGYLWISLGSLAVYFCEGASAKLFINYSCSSLAGLIWGFIGITMLPFLASLGLSPTYSVCIVLLLLTFGAVGLHLIMLEKTWFNKISMVFATLAFVFSQGGNNLWQIALSILGGFILGMAISAVGGLLSKKMLAPADNENTETQKRDNVGMANS